MCVFFGARKCGYVCVYSWALIECVCVLGHSSTCVCVYVLEYSSVCLCVFLGTPVYVCVYILRYLQM